MADKPLLDDVRFYGQHGVTPAEREVGAWYSVDAEALLREFPAHDVRVRVRKLTPPLGFIGTPGVELVRTR
jgi:dihydroneopterin aldolase